MGAGPAGSSRFETVKPLRKEAMNTRELAQRINGMVEVRLLWHPELDRVELAVHDFATDVSFELEVAPADAIDAFYHPYAYAARRTGRRSNLDTSDGLISVSDQGRE